MLGTGAQIYVWPGRVVELETVVRELQTRTNPSLFFLLGGGQAHLIYQLMSLRSEMFLSSCRSGSAVIFLRPPAKSAGHCSSLR